MVYKTYFFSRTKPSTRFSISNRRSNISKSPDRLEDYDPSPRIPGSGSGGSGSSSFSLSETKLEENKIPKSEASEEFIPNSAV